MLRDRVGRIEQQVEIGREIQIVRRERNTLTPGRRRHSDDQAQPNDPPPCGGAATGDWTTHWECFAFLDRVFSLMSNSPACFHSVSPTCFSASRCPPRSQLRWPPGQTCLAQE